MKMVLGYFKAPKPLKSVITLNILSIKMAVDGNQSDCETGFKSIIFKLKLL